MCIFQCDVVDRDDVGAAIPGCTVNSLDIDWCIVIDQVGNRFGGNGRMQGDATIAQTGLGANFAVVQTAGSTTIGRSKNACDSDTVATTNTLPIRLVDFVDGPTSTVGDTYTDGIFRFNAGHQLTNTTGI